MLERKYVKHAMDFLIKKKKKKKRRRKNTKKKYLTILPSEANNLANNLYILILY